MYLVCFLFFLMIRPPPDYTLTYPLFPFTTLFRSLIPPLGRHPRALPEGPFCRGTEPLRRIGVPPLAWIAGSSPAMTVGKRGTTLASIICFRISIHEIPFRAPEHAGAVQAHLPAPGRRQEQYHRLHHQARRARPAQHPQGAVQTASQAGRVHPSLQIGRAHV